MSDNRISNIRNSTVRAFALGIITGSFITAGTMLLAAPARADGFLDDAEIDYAATYGQYAICPVIDEYHTTDGVMGVARAIINDGFAPDAAVDIINVAVQEFCPRNFPLLQAIGRAARGETNA